MTSSSLTFEQLCQLEPGLKTLYDEVKAISRKGNPKFCPNSVWYGYGNCEAGFKYRMSRLVGLHRKPADPVLSSSRAYDVCYAVLYGALKGNSHGNHQ